VLDSVRAALRVIGVDDQLQQQIARAVNAPAALSWATEDPEVARLPHDVVACALVVAATRDLPANERLQRLTKKIVSTNSLTNFVFDLVVEDAVIHTPAAEASGGGGGDDGEDMCL